MQELLPLAFIAVMFVGFYLLVLRPAKKRQSEAQALVNSVQAGDEVMTTAGIYGEVVSVDGDTISLEVAPGVQLKYARAAVARIIVDEPTAEPTALPTADATVPASQAANAAPVDQDNPYQRGQS